MVDPAESFGPSLNGLVQLATCRMLNEWTHKKPIGTGNNLNDSFSLLDCVCLCLSSNSHSISGFAFFSQDEDNVCKDPSSTAPEPSGSSRSHRSIVEQRCLFYLLAFFFVSFCCYFTFLSQWSITLSTLPFPNKLIRSKFGVKFIIWKNLFYAEFIIHQILLCNVYNILNSWYKKMSFP